MRTLIYCMTHLRTPLECKLLKIWWELLARQNTNFDALIVDSAAAFWPGDILPGWHVQWLVNDDHIPTICQSQTIAAFHNSLGHPWYDQIKAGSGSDRAQMKGFEIAIANNYDRVAYIEMDVLFARSVDWAFELMEKPTGCGPLVEHGQFPDNGLFFAYTQHLWKIDYVKRYNWRGPTQPAGEKRMWDILGDDLHILPIRGRRDIAETKAADLARHWPDGIDYITHALPETFAEFLRINNHSDLAEILCS